MPYPSSVDTGQVQPWTIATEAASLAGAATTLLVANAVYLYAFELPAGTNLITTGIKWRTGASVTPGTVDVGIYDALGNLLANTTGVTNVASSTMTGTFRTALSLTFGQYFMALTCSNATDNMLAVTGATSLSPTTRYRVATNASSGSPVQLPTTTGGYGASGANATRCPALELVITNGLT